MADIFIYPRRGEPFQVPLRQAAVRMGRAEDNDLVLADQFASSHHAAIVPAERGYALQDRGSKNGTFLNGRRIEGDAALRRGDEILIGSTRIVFDQESPTHVEFVDTVTLSESANTIMEVRDILKRPAAAAPRGRAAASASDLERERNTLSALSEVSQSLIYHLPMEKLLDHIMDLIATHVPMDRSVLMLQEGNPPQLVPRVVRTAGGGRRKAPIQVSRSVVGIVLGRNQSILVSDIGADSRFREQASLVKANVHSAICAPLWNNQEIIGIVYADRTAILEPFTEDDLRLLTLLANVAAVKIENARLFEQTLEKSRLERELALAAQIQRNFLPREPPVFPPFDIVGGARSCEQVGGDYYDYIPVDGRRLGVVVADVSGKGVGASLLMASLRAALHAEFQPGSDLAVLTARLNDFVHRSSEIHGFISFFCGSLDRETMEMSYVNAGHNPPLAVSPDGTVRRLESTGFCLGMFPAAVFETSRVRLGPGDVLCLFTDGIVEARDGAGQEFGDDRLAAVLRESAGLPAPGILEKVFAAVDGFSGSAPPADDMTCVIVRVTG